MSQAPAPHSFELISGTELVMNITVRDDDSAVVDLTGGSVRFAAARSRTSTIVLDSNASPQTATATITDAANGVIQVVVTDTITEDLSGDYYFECKFTDASGRETTVTRGWISVTDNLI